MRSRTAKILIVLTALVFFTDAIDGDIGIARFLNTVFHTSYRAISRDLLEDGSGGNTIQKSNRTIASTNVVAQDEDSPTTLDTAFPRVQSASPNPEAKVIATSPGIVKFTYLTLRTLLI